MSSRLYLTVFYLNVRVFDAWRIEDAWWSSGFKIKGRGVTTFVFVFRFRFIYCEIVKCHSVPLTFRSLFYWRWIYWTLVPSIWVYHLNSSSIDLDESADLPAERLVSEFSVTYTYIRHVHWRLHRMYQKPTNSKDWLNCGPLVSTTIL